jgi:hypothetical protein
MRVPRGVPRFGSRPVRQATSRAVTLSGVSRPKAGHLLRQIRLGGRHAVAFPAKIRLPALALFGLALVRLSAALRDADFILWASLGLMLPATEESLLICAAAGTGTNAAFRCLFPRSLLLRVSAGRGGRSKSKAISFASTAFLGRVLRFRNNCGIAMSAKGPGLSSAHSVGDPIVHCEWSRTVAGPTPADQPAFPADFVDYCRWLLRRRAACNSQHQRARLALLHELPSRNS